MEYFDIVDLQDKPTGEKPFYKESHAQGILHRCAAVYVFDSQGRLYVQKRRGIYPHLDHTVGGHVSSGEDYETAAIREAEEEVGLTEKLTLVTTGLYSDETYSKKFKIRHMFGIYECHPTDAWKFAPNDEVQEIYPESLENIVAQMMATPGKFAPGFISTMEAYLRIKKIDLKFDADHCRKNWRELRKVILDRKVIPIV